LQNYEFMDPEARAKFQELMEMLKKAMMDTFFKDLSNQIQGMTPEQLERMKQMIRDLNQMLQDKMSGGQPNFDEFMQQYGDLFGDNPPQSIEELIAQMQAQIAQYDTPERILAQPASEYVVEFLGRGRVAWLEALRRSSAEGGDQVAAGV